ncbi:MAG: 2-isopropylmalate synthase [Clostridiaceae bacterium]|nr:2-isopropylmalate synthase [Clostridiaceae bacterium]
MQGFEKYQKSYFMPPVPCYDWVRKDSIQKAPVWCSVDLRDGNQALIQPMSLEEKVEYFNMLVKIGFKEIEVGFPAASETEYNFLRALIDRKLIPEDVTVQVLTQAREHIIRKTFEAVDGAPNAIVHVYNSTSVAQREQVFRKSKEEIKQIAVDGAALLKELAEDVKGNIRFEYSPESFHGTEMDYAVEVCNAVLDVWQPTKEAKAVINIPSTVENAMPHVFASQVEFVSKSLKYRENVVLSLHPHNDRGCGVAAAELGVLAGADRLEGTLFGNGERTGNLDLVTMAMNLHSHGVDCELDFANMQQIKETYERLTDMQVSMREPYAGELVFTAFSGSHQDAISKGMAHREESGKNIWSVPYLPIDPKDVGRTYDSDVIRINSQSGKGGVAYVLKQNFGIVLPDKMREEVGYLMKGVSDHAHAELSPQEMLDVFEKTYSNPERIFAITEVHFQQQDGITTQVTFQKDGVTEVVEAKGNGRLNAVNNAIKKYLDIRYTLDVYEEHSLSQNSAAKAMAYVGITQDAKELYWGVSSDEDIIRASIDALEHAVNHMLMKTNTANCK